jgi:hypothetical protein
VLLRLICESVLRKEEGRKHAGWSTWSASLDKAASIDAGAPAKPWARCVGGATPCVGDVGEAASNRQQDAAETDAALPGAGAVSHFAHMADAAERSMRQRRRFAATGAACAEIKTPRMKKLMRRRCTKFSLWIRPV